MFRILIRTLAPAWVAVVVAGCGQSGALYLPTHPAAAHRATLPQSLFPSETIPAPAADASAPVRR